MKMMSTQVRDYYQRDRKYKNKPNRHFGVGKLSILKDRFTNGGYTNKKMAKISM